MQIGKRSPQLKACSGSTLLLVMWALFLLSAVIMYWAKYIEKGIAAAGAANRLLEAKALAHSGAVLGLLPKADKRSPFLVGGLDKANSYAVTLRSEGAKVNLNYMIVGEDAVRIAFLKAVLTKWGLSNKERDVFVDSLLDWVDQNDARHLNGMEKAGAYQPPNRGQLLSLDEIPKIRGSRPLVSKINWKDGFTLLSSGPLDIEAVSAEVLACVPGIGGIQSARFVAVRNGKDGVEGTPDDRVFRDLNEALGVLGLAQTQFAKLNGIIGFRDPILQIRSVGQAAGSKWMVEVVARRSDEGKAEIAQWNEREIK